MKGKIKDAIIADKEQALRSKKLATLYLNIDLGINVEDIGIIGDESNEVGKPIAPYLRVIDAINPCDVGFEEARAVGVTMAVVCPGSINVIGGQCTAIKTIGNNVEDMIIKSPVAIKAAMGEKNGN